MYDLKKRCFPSFNQGNSVFSFLDHFNTIRFATAHQNEIHTLKETAYSSAAREKTG